MKKGFGLIIIILVTLILFVIIFATTKLIIPNQKSLEVKKETTKNAEDAVQKYQQRNIQDQTIDINR